MLHLDPLAPRTPRLPHQRLGALTQLAASTALHVTLVVIAALIETTSAPGIDVRRAEPITDQQDLTFGISCFSRQSCHGWEGRGWRRQSATGANPSRAGRGRGHDHPASAKRAAANSPSDDSFRTCRRGRSSAPIDRARCEAAGLRPFRSDWTADRRRDVRHVDRSRVRGRRRHWKRDWYRLGTWPRTRPRIRRWNWRWHLPPWRGSIRTAPDQRSQA